MRRAFSSLLLTLVFGALTAQQLAFPGAVGFGRYATGGRDGTVYKVTNLNDSGPGSLRDAVSQPNRIVVFEVAGVIEISSRLVFSSNLTVAGQTAPGEGVVVYGNGVSFSGAHNVIVRNIAFRMGIGGDSGKDAAGIANGSNMIFDHVSVSWGRDETFSISWDNKGTEPSNITIQNSIIAQGLLNHSAGGLIQTRGGVTLFRNLYIDNHTRNPKVKGLNQFVNNVVYNWGGGGCYILGDSEGTSWATVENNYFINGPSASSNPYSRANSNFQLLASGNYHDGNRNGSLDGSLSVQADYGPAFWVESPDYWVNIPESDPNKIPQMHPELPGVMAADAAYAWIVDSVGKIIPARDQVDAFLISELTSLGTAGAIISSENDLPSKGPGKIFRGPLAVDSDGDGIPDSWETALGTDPNVDDAMVVGIDGYTNIERYFNAIKSSEPFLKYPVGLKAVSTTKFSLEFSWTNVETAEHEVVVEMSSDHVNFSEVGRVDALVTKFSQEELTSGTTYYFRLKSVSATMESVYSDVLSVKTVEEATPPMETVNPYPDDNQEEVAYRNLTLSWVNETSFMGGALYFDLYMGESAEGLTLLAEDQAKKSFTVETLQPGHTYFWQIKATNVLGESLSEVWRFSTREKDSYTMLAHFLFDEEAGSTALDQVSDTEAVATGFIPGWESGKSGNAIVFSGEPAASYLRFPHHEGIWLDQSSFSISVWFKSPGLMSDSYLLHKGMHDAVNGGNGKWFGIQYRPDRLTFGVDDNQTKSTLDLTDPERWFDNEWHHLVCIRNVEDQQLEIYLNGHLMGTKADNTLGGIGVLTDLIMGNCDGYHNTPFEGQMDDLRFYQGVLSSDAVYDLFANEVTSLRRNQFFDKTQMLAYPNPFKDQLTLYVADDAAHKLARVQIFNQTGVLVYSDQLSVFANRLEVKGLGGLSSGVYVCLVRLGTKMYSFKVQKFPVN
jgi:pectate lyase